MRVNEIFKSVQGEGIYTGLPTLFVRLQSCNLRCSYCDTPYAQVDEGGVQMSIADVLGAVETLQEEGWVCITGGEPLMQERELAGLVTHLKLLGYRVEIETNGSCVLPNWASAVDAWAIDVKCPYSGFVNTFQDAWEKFFLDCCNNGVNNHVLKFVVSTEEDLQYVEDFVKPFNMLQRSFTLISPAVTTSSYQPSRWLERVAEFCVYEDLRLSLQIHKIIWGNKRGV